MDIDLLSKMVKELILDSDKVVLPGLGCFVAEIVPSAFSDKGYTINPPYRRLSFRAKPDTGDELALFYASENNLDYDIADRIIKDFVSELKSVLHQKKNVVFPDLGRLRATKENAVFFVADENLDIYPAGFGLEPVSLKTNQETADEVSAAVRGLRSLLPDEPDTSDGPDMPYGPEVPDEAPCDETPGDSPVPEGCVKPENGVRSLWRTFVRVLAGISVTLVLLLALYMATAIFAPEWLDGLLYTQEELDILNYGR